MTKAEAAWMRSQLLQVMSRVRQTIITGRCAICGQPVAHWKDTGEARMVCSKARCYHLWLLPGMRVETDDDDTEVEAHPITLLPPDDDHDDDPVIDTATTTTTPTPSLPPIPF